MLTRRSWLAAVFSAVLCVAIIVVCGAQSTTEFRWDLPTGFPVPAVPADNPMSVAKVELGRHLFYDLRLSGNGQQSCATCHQQEKAFTDGLTTSAGSTGEDHPRNSMSLVNVAYASTLTWANPTMTRLEDQALVPMFGRHPIELGLGDDRGGSTRCGASRDTSGSSSARFQERPTASRASTSSEPSPRFRGPSFPPARPTIATTSSATTRRCRPRRSAAKSCFTAGLWPVSRVTGASFSLARRAGPASAGTAGGEFHNTGLYNLPGLLSYPAPNTGIHEFTRDPKDVGKFKAPTLRNIAVTAPYMHDGSIDSLEGVLAHYEAGGRTLTEGPHKGVGRDNPNKSERVRGFSLTPDERADLIAFLRSLTDESLLRDPRFANPWRR